MEVLKSCRDDAKGVKEPEECVQNREKDSCSEFLNSPAQMKWGARMTWTLAASFVIMICYLGNRGEHPDYAYTERGVTMATITQSQAGELMLANYNGHVVVSAGKEPILIVDPKQYETQPGSKVNNVIKVHRQGGATSEPMKILLVTYFRGGSSFLGEVFNQNRRAFYWFEPLAMPVFQFKDRTGIKDFQIDRQGNALARPKDLVDQLTNISHDILACDIDNLDHSILSHYFATKWKKSTKFTKYQRCLNGLRENSKFNVRPFHVDSCRHLLTKPCLNSDIRVIKSIRLFMVETIALLRRDKGLRLVYYVRDPRGMLLSRLSLTRKPLDMIPYYKIVQVTAMMCAKMRADLHTAVRLREILPDRVILLRYEDLATNPQDTVRDVYDFLGLEIPKPVTQWVRAATHAQNVTEGMLSTLRANSTAVATRWQHELPPNYIKIIHNHCSDVIDAIDATQFGYVR